MLKTEIHYKEMMSPHNSYHEFMRWTSLCTDSLLNKSCQHFWCLYPSFWLRGRAASSSFPKPRSIHHFDCVFQFAMRGRGKYGILSFPVVIFGGLKMIYWPGHTSQRRAHNIFNMWVDDGGWWSFFSLGFRELWKRECRIQLLIGFGRPRLRCSKNNMHFNYREMFSCGNVCWDWIWTLDHIEFCLNVCYRFITM